MDIYLVQHGKHCFTMAAIFSGSPLEGCGEGGKVSGEGEQAWHMSMLRAEWWERSNEVAEEQMLLRLSLLITLTRLFLFSVSTSSKD